jgi:hypothetical protein
MRGFFNPWRRKIGVVTLAVACVVMVAWVRSLSVKDLIEFSDITGFAKKENRLAALATERQSLVLMVYKITEVVSGVDDGTANPVSQSGQVDIPLPASLVNNPPHVLSIKAMPTQPSKSTLTAVYRVPLVIIPFWTLATPLTLVSLWLLLSKPQSAKTTEIPATKAG